jgi:hypothetical protein
MSMTVPSMTAPSSAKAIRPASSRVESVDFFRGLAIIGMIIVNNPGSSEEQLYTPLNHAEWNGWTPTDLIFPFFLFAMGVSLAYSIRFSPQTRRVAPTSLAPRSSAWGNPVCHWVVSEWLSGVAQPLSFRHSTPGWRDATSRALLRDGLDNHDLVRHPRPDSDGG